MIVFYTNADKYIFFHLPGRILPLPISIRAVLAISVLFWGISVHLYKKRPSRFSGGPGNPFQLSQNEQHVLWCTMLLNDPGNHRGMYR